MQIEKDNLTGYLSPYSLSLSAHLSSFYLFSLSSHRYRAMFFSIEYFLDVVVSDLTNRSLLLVLYSLNINQIGEEGCRHLADALKSNRGLTVLR